jgi:hypothetical protein
VAAPLTGALQQHHPVADADLEAPGTRSRAPPEQLVQDLPADLLVGRKTTLRTSDRLTIPTSRPAASITGSCLIRFRRSSLAASAALASDLMVMAGAVIISTAVPLAALSRSSR